MLSNGNAAALNLHVRVVDPSGRPVPQAAVYAIPGTPVPANGAPKAIIDQINRHFVPRISVIQTGTSVSFPNSDNIRHSVYSFSAAKTFTLKIYAGVPASPVVFDKPGIVVMGCNIHDSMVAWVLVVDTPYFSMTDASGGATIENLDAGNYRLRAWSPVMRHEEQGETLEIRAAPLPALTLQIQPDEPEPADASSMNETMEGMPN